jgi:hypothetical protein
MRPGHGANGVAHAIAVADAGLEIVGYTAPAAAAGLDQPARVRMAMKGQLRSDIQPALLPV